MAYSPHPQGYAPLVWYCLSHTGPTAAMPEWKITAGHWPISTISLKWPIKVSTWCIHFVHMANQIHEELEKWPTISNFLFCALHAVSMQSLWKQLKLSQHSVKGLLNALDFDRKLVNLFGQ